MRRYKLEELRERHKTCVTARDVARDYHQGRIPRYDPKIHTPACSCPEDGICLGPNVPDDAYEEYEGTT